MARKLQTASAQAPAPAERANGPSAPAFDGLANVWLDAFQEGARTWTSAAANMMETFVAAGQAQAELVGEVMSFWSKNSPMGSLNTLLRDELFLTESAGERLSDAARCTLRDISKTAGPGQAPVTLPE